MKNQVRPIPEGYQTVTPYLVVKGAREAIDFYKRAFGAKELFHMDAPEGKIGHAELQLGTSRVMLSDPQVGTSTTNTGIFLYVDDVDAFARNAVAAGAKMTQPIADMFWGDRFGRITDPFGIEWMVATHTEDVPPEEMKRRMEAAMRA